MNPHADESVNRRIAQHGSAPDGMVAFGIVLDTMHPASREAPAG
ncbi:hypothetical protein [Burkholderia sp. PU8-34]